MALINDSKKHGKRSGVILSILILVAVGATATEFEMGTEFTYQGDLQFGGAPAEGAFDFEFHLYDQAEGGTFFGLVTRNQLSVAGGSFATRLDFGVDIFSRWEGWVEIYVRSVGDSTFSELSPRQRVSGSRGSACTVSGDLVVEGNLAAGGITVPKAPIDITSQEATLSVNGGGAIRIRGGLLQLLIDSDEIQTGGLGFPAPLKLNEQGGNVGIASSSPAAPLHVGVGGPDVSPTGGGVLVLGPTNGTNMALDNNEIMARFNGSPSSLYLNHEGGNVHVGGDLHIGLEIVKKSLSEISFISVSCSSGKQILGGGCWNNQTADLRSSNPSGNGWHCSFDSEPHTVTVWAICADIGAAQLVFK